jgi:aminoglycoside phosphotransferase (APT) family kinase protein
MDKAKETIPVRQGEEMDWQAVESYLKEHVEEIGDGKLEVEQFSAGHSNLTYLIRIGDWEAVLRRPPLGPVAPKAHDMEREAKILRLLHPHFNLAPKPYVFCSDLSVIGSIFYVMERRKGQVLDHSFPPGYEAAAADGERLSRIMVDTLVDLHQVDYKAAGLDEIGYPQGFMERQVHGWIKRYDKSKTDEIPGVEALGQWMVEHIPVSPNPTIVHYDFKFNNMMFSENLTRVVGLFDWEMTTIGDPLADLGVAMGYWTESGDPDFLKRGMGHLPLTAQPGFLSRRQFIDAYASKTGTDVSNMNFYMTFAYFKNAVILQQIYYRWKKGQTQDARFAKFGDFVRNLLTHAHDVAHHEKF